MILVGKIPFLPLSPEDMKRLLLLTILVCFSGCTHAAHTVIAVGGRIDFHLSAPGAGSVTLVVIGQTVEHLPAHQSKNGDWEAEVLFNSKQPLHDLRYFYLVNGKVYLPPCRMKDTDDFGAENCVISASEILQTREGATW
jgi:hypothetical protein